MIRLHLSDRLYSGDEVVQAAWHGRPLQPKAACGSSDGRHVIARGNGEGLVPPRAISSEYHCGECVRIIRGGTL